MNVEDFLSRLHRVKPTGRGTWLACCPAHDDRNPSLSIRETDDGRILLKCFPGCSADEIVGAVGLELHDLFPEKPIEYAEPLRRPFPAGDVLEAVADETLYVALVAANVAHGMELSDADRERLMIAHERIMEARRLSLGER
jgi:DNA primase